MSKRHFLEFEQPIAELETKIEELRYVQNESAVDISEEIDRLDKKSQQLAKDIYANLSPWQVTQIARHPQRPYTLDYLNEIFTDFQELHGDRAFAWRASTARPAWSSATRRVGTRRSAACATSACRARKAIARPCA
jgi:acetyl-CoA carboxylase alpha subunit